MTSNFTPNLVRFLTKTNKKMTRLECTSKVQRLRLNKTDDEVSKKLGISKPTLYVRIKQHNWKVSEIYLIEKMTL